MGKKAPEPAPAGDPIAHEAEASAEEIRAGLDRLLAALPDVPAGQRMRLAVALEQAAEKVTRLAVAGEKGRALFQ